MVVITASTVSVENLCLNLKKRWVIKSSTEFNGLIDITIHSIQPNKSFTSLDKVGDEKYCRKSPVLLFWVTLALHGIL